MQEHLKERLTGAIILLLLVVLLVPEMFRGQPAARTDRASASSDELPVRSYTIDLRGGGATPSLAAGAAPPAALVPAPVNTPPVSSAAPPPAHEATTVPPATTAPGAGVSAGAGASAGTAGHSVARPSLKGQWLVQVATYTRRDFAEHQVRQMRANGFVVVVAGPDDRGRYRVRSVPLADQAAAAAVRQKMLARGLKPIVVPPQ